MTIGTNFTTRYKKLNQHQKEAVDTIDGPLLVVAGPGTGKTELLSMRAANILRQTDTLPSSILCLTFTDSGAVAMRERLASIIGPEAYKVAIHTFHSFGTETINQNPEYFYQGASFKPADELLQYEILREIFDELDHHNPLASKLNGEYTYLKDALGVISELKRSGLTSEELRKILESNQEVIDTISTDIQHAFANRISNATLFLLPPIAEKIANIPMPALPPAITPYANTLALSLAHAVDEARELGKTTPITAWKKQWCELDSNKNTVLKDAKRGEKLTALLYIYSEYTRRMEEAGLYDYDDMILQVIHAMETHKDFRANVQEKFQYIMVDEFQDTNLSQLRILFDLTTDIEHPNVMAVGDDDQAIYSFQGADINNIHAFRTTYSDPKVIVLTDNYRSTAAIIEGARAVITQGNNRLENTIEGLSKLLTPHSSASNTAISLVEHTSPLTEHQWIAQSIADCIAAGTPPSDIAVIARKHSQLIELLPFLANKAITVQYEKRDNVLENPAIKNVILLAETLYALAKNDHATANALLPEIISHPAFTFSAEDIWKLSIASHRNHQTWLETMLANTTFSTFANWLITTSQSSTHLPLEQLLDTLLGIPNASEAAFASPYYAHYFSETERQKNPSVYIDTLEAFRTIREKLREHFANYNPTLEDFLEYIAMHDELGTGITTIRSAGNEHHNAVQLLSAHKSKGLEFNHVYVLGAIDTTWGEKVRGKSRKISYPANLRLAPAGDTYDERLRLFYVAMTRAKQTLAISYSSHDAKDKPTLPASFLTNGAFTTKTIDANHETKATEQLLTLDWQRYIAHNPSQTMKELLQPTLETYKLSATHLNNFIDITRGGPETFLINNLLYFPQAKQPSASYGTAIHATLQRAHTHLSATGSRRPIEDLLADFEANLRDQHLAEPDFETFLRRGADALQLFFTQKYSSFAPTQKSELSFSNQQVLLGDARLTGNLDLVDINSTAKTIVVTDYKTGKPAKSWTGSTDFEKIKLHKYRQQLMFYQLLVKHSRDYSNYAFTNGVLQFVEPDTTGDIHALEAQFTTEELVEFSKLIESVWHAIMSFDFPDIAEYPQTYKGVLAFEQALIDKNYN